MRPQSIVMFERLFLASLALSVLSFILNYGDMTDVLARDPGMQQLGIGSGLVVGVAVAGYAIYLLLWYLIARRASNVAKWILGVFTALGVLFSLPGLAGPWTLNFLLTLVASALGVAAVVYLFHPDAKAWLDGKRQVDPATFD